MTATAMPQITVHGDGNGKTAFALTHEWSPEDVGLPQDFDFSFLDKKVFKKGQRVRINAERVLNGYWLREGDTALVVEDSSTVTHETRVAFDGHQNMAGAYADLVPTSWLEVAA